MLFARLRIAAIAGSIAALATAAPAMAETNENEAALPEARSSHGTTASSGNFGDIMSAWESIERGQTPAPRPAVAVPSRMPVEGVRVSSGYGMRNHPVLRTRKAHKGIDLAGPTGTPVYATADGAVDKAYYSSSYGNVIYLDHGASMETRYAHLSRYVVSDGEQVKKGQLIGYVGSTGRSTGPHLHYEVRIAGEAVNPLPYMVESRAEQAFALEMGEGGIGGDE